MAGVLIRNAEALEVLAKVDTLVIDKTGTLTEGKPRVARINPQPGWTETDLLRLAASIERGSEHPLAGAIVAAARNERSCSLAQVTEFRSVTGQGVTGTVDGHARGARKRSSSSNRWASTAGNLASEAEDMRGDGSTAIFLAVDASRAAVLAVNDPHQAVDARSPRPCCTRKACASSC